MAGLNPDRLREITSSPSLLAYLEEELEWPIVSGGLDEISFSWEANELRITDRSGAVVKDGTIRQLRSLVQGQPWGVFFIEFLDDKIHRTALREILRGLVPNRRQKPDLPGWDHEDLLFICVTQDFQRVTFVHFRGAQRQKARLASFGWERESSYLRTLCEFNLPGLRWPDDPTDAAAWRTQWAKAFDKEPLTREFFKRFEQALELVKGDLEKYQKLPSGEAYSCAQLLLERLLFLYFLQNRGWLNQNRSFFLQHLAPHRDKPEAFSFYAEFLEKLFWSLASAPGSGGRFENIPFLNGGLFDDDEFSPDPIRLKRNPPLRVRNGTFAGVFDSLLEAFNFTVREDTPLNQDVAVDPEMLGKVFESIVLHAEAADPDAIAPDKRKATGSYYTPRIVVHFICREALRQYLMTHLGGNGWPGRLQVIFGLDATDGLNGEELAQLRSTLKPVDGRRLLDVLKSIKACDPAVGSGAFPVGLLHELVNLRRIAETVANGFIDPVRQRGNVWIHQTKEHIIENCLYGVDIQQQAIEICRLRLWMSLIIDYDLGPDPFVADRFQFHQAIQHISQLPNLEMNFRRGDSLLDQISNVSVRVDPRLPGQFEDDVARIHKLGLDLHRAKKAERKRNLRVEILRKRLDLSEKVLVQEITELKKNPDWAQEGLFGRTASQAEQKRRIEQEITQIEKALDKIAADRRQLEKTAARPMDRDFYPKLRQLEGAGFKDPFNFVWRVDFADIFSPRADGAATTINGEFGLVNEATIQQSLVGPTMRSGGFDLILGNPPFVTARNPKKRELYRERWKRVSYGKYLLVCPFFDLSFNLLRPGGQLGFIVSNAFAKREFGKPLIEDFFPTVDLQKVVDCSGLMFPGHGTPTWIVFGRNLPPDPGSAIRVTAILPGGGDLRTMPEKSPLWQAIETHHDDPGYADNRIAVADRPRIELAKHPWAIVASTEITAGKLESTTKSRLRELLTDEIGVCTMTNADDIFLIDDDLARRFSLSRDRIRPYHQGEEFKNWEAEAPFGIVLPYGSKCEIDADETLDPSIRAYLAPFRATLENRHTFANKTFKEAGRVWFEFERMNANKYANPLFITFAHLSTHNHFVFIGEPRIFGRHSQVLKLPDSSDNLDHHTLVGLLNTSAVLFWLKRKCFNKGAGEDEERDRFEYGGGNVQQLPVPNAVAEALQGRPNAPANALQALSEACWERGRQMPTLALKKLFEKPGEAYHDWNASLSGYTAPDPRLGSPFSIADNLRTAITQAMTSREQLRAEMIALQEEMDWIVYVMYGLLPEDSGVLSSWENNLRDSFPLAREERSFVLWNQAGGDLESAASLIPADWSEGRKILWRARLLTIHDDEHIRRIEQPVYKRRWDEQWKVGNRWQCGPIAYDAELADAFFWWLSEKAEWWLENKKGGGPVSLEEWFLALRQDARILAAWEVVNTALTRLNRKTDFSRYFAVLVKSQSVPDDIPIAIPWDELEKKLKRKIPAAVKRIRGKLNVPRERFRVTTASEYIWAGKPRKT